MPAVAWVTVEKALQDFVQLGTGLADTNVMWEDGKPRPLGAYCSLSLTLIANPANDWREWRVNPAPTVDDEVQILVRGQRRCEMQVQCIATPATGLTAARALLNDLVTSLGLPSRRALLDAAGIGAIGFEPVQTVGAFTNLTVFEPRAVTVFAFNVASELIDTTIKVGQVKVTPTINGTAQPTQTITPG